MTPEKIAEIEKRVRDLSIRMFVSKIKQADDAADALHDRIQEIDRLLVSLQSDHDRYMAALGEERSEIVAALVEAGRPAP